MPICRVPPSKPTARLPATTPTKISTSATEIPVRIETKLPMSAKPIQIEAISQMFPSIKKLLPWKESLAHAVFPVLPRKANSIAVAGVYRIFASIQGVRQAMPLPHNDRVFGGLHLEALAEIKLTADGIVDQEIFCTFAFHPAVVNQVSAVHYGKRLTHIVIGDHDGSSRFTQVHDNLLHIVNSNGIDAAKW